MSHAFHAQVLSKYDANFEYCDYCGYLRAENPFWLNEAYSNPIAQADTGIVVRNIKIAFRLAGILFFVLGFKNNDPILDAAGGYGLLTRLMRDIGYNFYWQDLHCKNLFALGFEYSGIVKNCQIVTAIEVIEHVQDPIEFIQLQLMNTGARHFIFTTELYVAEPPSPDSWWYYSFETGQHISFFKKKTLQELAKKLNMQFFTAGDIHIFSLDRINKPLFMMVTNIFLAPLFAVLARYLLGSKTMSDHKSLLKKDSQTGLH